jgi:intracellular sulfur oxidation DsrE/DsrF family protein
MNRFLIALLAAAAVAGCATAPQDSGASGGGREMKMAFDITEGDPAVLLRKINTIDLTRKQLIAAGMTPRMVLAFRGGATYYTQTELAKVKESDRAAALQIAAAIRELRKQPGIEAMEQCNVTVTTLKLNPKALMPEIQMTPNGWISIVSYQHRGYGYVGP